MRTLTIEVRYRRDGASAATSASEVAASKSGPVGAAPYLFLGPATLEEYRGERPIAITWRLAIPMPQTFFDAASAPAA